MDKLADLREWYGIIKLGLGVSNIYIRGGRFFNADHGGSNFHRSKIGGAARISSLKKGDK